MKKIPRQGYTRHEREARALENLELARREVKGTYDCSPRSLYALVRANRDIAHARSHLVNIGFHTSKRSARLWQLVGRGENEVNEAGNRLARCLLGRGT